MKFFWFPKTGLSLVLILLGALAKAAPVIVEKPIRFDKERIKLTQQYQRQRYGIRSKSITIDPKMIVIHCTHSKTFSQAYNYFNRTRLPAGRAAVSRGGEVNVSAHYMVDRDGKIFRLMPDNWMARHVIGLNPIAIGIENVGCSRGKEDLTNAQLKANAELVSYLVKKYPRIKYLIGHQEYLEFYNTDLWYEKDKSYCTAKSDPGQTFMRPLRELVKQYDLYPGVELRPIYICRPGGVRRQR